jgi:hypothetical protein
MSATKSKNRKQKRIANKKTKNVKEASLPSFLTNDTFFLIASLVLAGLFFSYSFFSNGFYQQDGPAHYVQMRDFWNNPNVILGTWAKTGFKVIYVLPALIGGVMGVKLTSSLLAAFSSYFAYKVTKTYNERVAFLAFILLATQHMWINFSFRTYSEIATAFVLVLGVYFHRKESFIASALAFSYIGFIRPEAYLIGGLYFLYLLYKKHYIPALVTSTFPLIYNIWGFIANGEPLYLITSILGTNEAYKGAWDKMGFDHYFKFLSEVHGGLLISLVVAFIGSWILSKKKNIDYWVFVAPAAIFLLMQSLFNMQSIIIGPYTGGTVRYLLVIAPLLAIMGALGAAQVEKLENKFLLLLFLVPLFLITATYLSFEMPSVTITNVKKWDSTIMIALGIACILLPLSMVDKLKKYYLYAALAIFSVVYSVKPYLLNSEDKTMSEVADWVNNNYSLSENRAIFINHPLFYYFLGKSQNELKPAGTEITNDERMKNAPKGSIVIWESHYGYRPKRANYELQYTYFTERPNEYKLVKQFFPPDKRFVAFVFEKL